MWIIECIAHNGVFVWWNRTKNSYIIFATISRRRQYQGTRLIMQIFIFILYIFNLISSPNRAEMIMNHGMWIALYYHNGELYVFIIMIIIYYFGLVWFYFRISTFKRT